MRDGEPGPHIFCPDDHMLYSMSFTCDSTVNPDHPSAPLTASSTVLPMQASQVMMVHRFQELPLLYHGARMLCMPQTEIRLLRCRREYGATY